MEHVIQGSKKQYALVLVLIPEETWRKDSTVATNIARQFLDEVEPNESVLAIGPCSFLCDLSHGLRSLSTIVHIAEKRRVQLRTLFFDQEPSWVSS